jgi:hypothetical protein
MKMQVKLSDRILQGDAGRGGGGQRRRSGRGAGRGQGGAEGINQVQVQAGNASVQSADTRNRMSLVSVAWIAPVQNAEPR